MPSARGSPVISPCFTRQWPARNPLSQLGGAEAPAGARATGRGAASPPPPPCIAPWSRAPAARALDVAAPGALARGGGVVEREPSRWV